MTSENKMFIAFFDVKKLKWQDISKYHQPILNYIKKSLNLDILFILIFLLEITFPSYFFQQISYQCEIFHTYKCFLGFISFWESERERESEQRRDREERERIPSRLHTISTEPNRGLISWTVRSWPEPKLRVRSLGILGGSVG